MKLTIESETASFVDEACDFIAEALPEGWFKVKYCIEVIQSGKCVEKNVSYLVA